MAAKQGNRIAQYNLSLCYLNELGVRKSLPASFRWNLRAAHSGHTDAVLAAGWFYHGGRGVKRDLSKAKVWYLKAAKKGDTSAMFSLGQMAYDNRSFAEALHWFTKAAKTGHPRSNYYLGAMLLWGKGVAPDPFRAKNCLEAAVNSGVGYARRVLNGLQLRRCLNRENACIADRWRQAASSPAV
jgi:hypothetical protein